MKDQFNYIEAYLNNRLTPSERLDFEKALQQDPDLQEDLRLFSKIEPFLDILVEDDIRQKIQAIKLKDKKVVWINQWRKIAAGILVLCVVMAWIWGNVANTPERLFTTYYHSPPAPHTRDINSGQSLSEQQRLSIRAHELLKQNEIEQSEIIFNQLALSDNKPVQLEAQWFLVLTALKAGNEELAKIRLEGLLSNDDGSYEDKARLLQRRLSGFWGIF